MQTIHDNVTVLVAQCELPPGAPKPEVSSTSRSALQYVAENAGFDTVTFRVDFRASVGIRLCFPGERTRHDAIRSTAKLTFECELHPFERRVLVYVVKQGNKRAFVRVQYAVMTVVAPSIDAVVAAQGIHTKRLMQQLERSKHIFNHISDWAALARRARVEVNQVCAEINRYFQRVGDVFVDVSFPPIAKALHDSESTAKFSDPDMAIYSLCIWRHLHAIADSSWTLVASPKVRSQRPTPDPLSISLFTSGLPAQDSFLCAMSLIAPYYETWLHRWFPSLDAMSQVENLVALPVALCEDGVAWRYVIIDLFLPSFPLGRGLMAPRNGHGELYPALLHKAYAKLKGSYGAVASISTITILRELTGSPWVCVYSTDEETDSSIEQLKLQDAVQGTLSHRRPESANASSLVVVTCGIVDNHYRAFQLTLPNDDDFDVNVVVLHDMSDNYLCKQLAGHIEGLESGQDPSKLCLSWEQLLALKPAVWSLALDQQYERRVRQIFRNQSSTMTMTVVMSVPTLTTITFSSSFCSHFASETRGQQADMDISFALVGNDFSLIPFDNKASPAVTRSRKLIGNCDGLFRNQVVKTLSAGEYVVTISVRSKTEEVVPASDAAILSPASVDANLQLIFDCLDREGRHEVSGSDLTSFMQLHEHVAPSQHGEEILDSYLRQNANSQGRGEEEKSLMLDDFREIYVCQAIRDCHVASRTTPASDRIRARFRELVWEDLLRLLSSDLKRDNLDSQNVVDVVCCLHSDLPVLSVVSLCEEKSK